MIALGGYSVSFLARLMRSSLLEVMGQDYIRTARAKGISELRVITHHALRNAIIPVITVLGPTVANLLTGSFVIEKIFAIPGMLKATMAKEIVPLKTINLEEQTNAIRKAEIKAGSGKDFLLAQLTVDIIIQ